MELNPSENDSTKSAFSHLYKTSTEIPCNQNKRRAELLEEQKSRRNALLDEFRGISDEITEELNPKHKYKRYNNEKFRNRIMFSEWLVDIPPDFDVSWFMKFSPKGHRNLVVAENGTTKSFSKTGRFEYEFESALPGGAETNPRKTTILDCIWNNKTKTFYILDVLMWADYDLTPSEAEFRFFWLNSKISEIPELDKISTNNTYKFINLPHFECDYSIMKDNLEKFPFFENNKPKIDGLLFYHKEASYTPGNTPLVGWLKPFMIPEVFNIHIASQYLSQKPQKYVNFLEYIQYYNEKTQINQMEISYSEEVCEENNTLSFY